MKVTKLVIAVVIGAALFAVLVCVSVAFDVAWAKFIGYLVACALHASMAILVSTALLARPVQNRAAAIVVRVVAALGALGLLWVLFEVGIYVAALPVDGRWKAAYFLATATSFWLTLGIALAILSPRVNTDVIQEMAMLVMAGVATFGVTTVAIVVGIGLVARARQNDVDRDPIAIPAVQTVAPGAYLALGDSYSAGEGLGPFEDGTDRKVDGKPACHRSPLAYPHLLSFTASAPVTLDFRSCSGAITADVDLPPIGDRDLPAQLDGQVRDDVSLVTITVGGNDEAFSRVVQNCFYFEYCIDASFEPPLQGVDRRRVIFPGKEPLSIWATDALTLLGRNLDRVYGKLADRYPNARIVVIGYPYLFPSGSAPLWQKDCGIVLRRVSEEERDGLRRMTDALNLEIYQRAVRLGLEFVSPTQAWQGHEPCGSKGQYTNAIKPFGESMLDGGSFHPNSQGQRMIARLVACYLNATPQRPAPLSDPPGVVPDSPACPP